MNYNITSAGSPPADSLSNCSSAGSGTAASPSCSSTKIVPSEGCSPCSTRPRCCAGPPTPGYFGSGPVRGWCAFWCPQSGRAGLRSGTPCAQPSCSRTQHTCPSKPGSRSGLWRLPGSPCCWTKRCLPSMFCNAWRWSTPWLTMGFPCDATSLDRSSGRSSA